MQSESKDDIFQPWGIKQENIIASDSDITIAAFGTQSGKSLAGSYWMMRQIAEYKDPNDNFLICAPSYKILQQSIMPYFLQRMEGWGTYVGQHSMFRLSGGGAVYFRTETDPDSIVGIPNVRAGWIDEAGLVRLYFWENYQARAASRGAKTLLTTSPYSMNWLYKDFIRPKRSGLLPHVNLIQGASWENPYHTLSDPEKRKAMRASMDPRRFDMVFGGEWGAAQGLVYDCFDEDQNIIDPFRLPHGTVYYGGIDWGHTEPFVLTIRAITPDNNHFQVYEYYKTGMTVPAQMELVKSQMKIFNVKRFFCGHERPENILLFNQNGISSEGVPEKDIQVGTDLHYELMKTRQYKIFRNTSPYTLDEIATYHYPEPEDLKPDQDSKELKPVGQNDHAMSANRFITLRTYKSGIKKTPHVPGEGQKIETHEQRINRLKRPRHAR